MSSVEKNQNAITFQKTSWTASLSDEIETLQQHPSVFNHFKAVGSAASVPLVALAESALEGTRAIAFSAVAIAAWAAEKVHLDGKLPKGYFLYEEAWRLVHALALLAEAVVATVTLPFAVVMPRVMVKECDLFHLRNERKQQPVLQNPASPLSNPADTLKLKPQTASWLTKTWAQASDWCRRHPDAVKAGAGVAVAFGLTLASYWVYQNWSDSSSSTGSKPHSPHQPLKNSEPIILPAPSEPSLDLPEQPQPIFVGSNPFVLPTCAVEIQETFPKVPQNTTTTEVNLDLKTSTFTGLVNTAAVFIGIPLITMYIGVPFLTTLQELMQPIIVQQTQQQQQTVIVQPPATTTQQQQTVIVQQQQPPVIVQQTQQPQQPVIVQPPPTTTQQQQTAAIPAKHFLEAK